MSYHVMLNVLNCNKQVDCHWFRWCSKLHICWCNCS